MKRRAPPDQNWASLKKFIDKIRECYDMKTIYCQKLPTNKPKGLKVVKEDQRSIGLMVNRLDG